MRRSEKLEREMEILKMRHQQELRRLVNGAIIFFVTLMTLCVGAAAAGPSILSWEFVAIVGILALSTGVYLSFVFNRQMSLRTSISSKGKEIWFNNYHEEQEVREDVPAKPKAQD